MTRTFAVGDVPDEIREYHRLCKEADLQLAVHRSERRRLHRDVSLLFGEHGYATQRRRRKGSARDGFYHGLGHGVGFAVHEAPGLGLIGLDSCRAM